MLNEGNTDLDFSVNSTQQQQQKCPDLNFTCKQRPEEEPVELKPTGRLLKVLSEKEDMKGNF